MSKVIRISDKTENLLTEYRNLITKNIAEKSEFPYMVFDWIQSDDNLIKDSLMRSIEKYKK